MIVLYGELAQLGEHLPCTQGVKGSNPLFSTTSLAEDSSMYLENWIKYQIVYKQVNNENEIEINHKSVFSKFCGFWNSWEMESKDTISKINRENQKIFTTSKTVVKKSHT